LDLLNTQRESSGMILRAESQHVVLNLNHNQYQRLIQLDSRCKKLFPWNLWLRNCVSPCATPARLP
jgi:hypothetical protein